MIPNMVPKRQSAVRFGEAYRVEVPLTPVIVGHDGLDFVRPADVTSSGAIAPGSQRWQALKKLLDPRATEVMNVKDPKTDQESTYIIRNGPTEDTFDQLQGLRHKLQKRLQELMGHARATEKFLPKALPLHGIITGNEPTVNLGDSDTPGETEPKHKKALQAVGILA